MEKKLTDKVLDRLIREVIEEQERINSIEFSREDFPEHYSRFKETEYGNDADGLDYPTDDDEDAFRFNLHMRYNYPDAKPSAQAQVGYDDANNVSEIGDGALSDEPSLSLSDLGLNEAVVREITKKATKEVLMSAKKSNKKNIANLYPGNVTNKSNKKNGK